jgi:hypothetical protein
MRPEAERRTIEAFCGGAEADLQDLEPLSANFLRQLCSGAIPDAAPGPAGLRLRHAEVKEKLDLTGLQLGYALWLRDSELAELVLTDTQLLTLNLAGSSCAGMTGDRLAIERGMLLSKKFTSTGRVALRDASVGGDLNCIGAQFLGGTAKRSALLLDGARIGGRLFLRNDVRGGKQVIPFRVEGRVQAISIKIEGALVCHHATFHNPGGTALDFGSAKVGSGGSFPGCTIHGNVSLANATFAGPVSFRSWKTPLDGELDLRRLDCGADLVCPGFVVSGRSTLPEPVSPATST